MTFSIDGFPGTQFTKNGKTFLYFGGTAYLAVQVDAAFQEIFVSNLKRFGTNYSASRKSNVGLKIFGEIEAYLAQIVGSEACITLSSGYLAGQFMAQYFSDPAYRRFYAPKTHSALLTPENRTVADYATLQERIEKSLVTDPHTVPVVFLDSIEFNGRNYPDFLGLKQLPLERVILVVDDSHGIGILGENGGSIYKSLRQLPARELLVCCSLGKGFGVQAGALFGNKIRIANCMDTDFFGGASPPAPAALATIKDAEGIYAEKRQLLRQNITYFKNGLKDLSRFAFMPDHPAFSFENPILAKRLEDWDIIVTNFKYPSDGAQSMGRIVLTAGHVENDIDRLCKCLNDA